MGEPHIVLRQTHILGERTTERRVGVTECEALRRHGILLCGLSDTAPPYCMVRPKLEWSECVVTLSGQGLVWLGSGWRTVGAGEAYVAGAGAMQAFKTAGGKRWRFAWVHRERGHYEARPRVTRVDGQDLAAVISTLHHEVLGGRDGTVLTHLAALVDAFARRLGNPEGDQRLRSLWRAVDADPGRAWSLRSLAAVAGVSTEHLRRLTLSEQGVTPMRQVAELRLRRAAALLHSSKDKLEAIAESVGYGSVYSFSAAFKHWSGHAPGAWRTLRGAQ